GPMIARASSLLLVAGLLAVLVQPTRFAWGAACVTACKPMIASCRSSDCAGLTKKALRHCKKQCAKSIVKDYYQDLTVCGATIARPAKPPASSGGSGGIMGGW